MVTGVQTCALPISLLVGAVNLQACGQCKVGAESCACTGGGGCDPGLKCLSSTCVDENSQSSSFATMDGEGSSTSSSSTGTDTASTESDSTGAEATDSTTGDKLDSATTGGDGGGCNITGCNQIDVLFAIDGSGSMAEEINALIASSAFSQVVTALEEVNCDDIEYRIGVTNDSSPNFITGASWTGSVPWFDSGGIANKQQIGRAHV